MQRAYRLRSNTDFRRVRSRKRSWAQPLLVLHTAPNEVGYPRLGIAVSRRVGNAVVRNRVRRRVREAVRARLFPATMPPNSPGVDLVFDARTPSGAADWPALRAAVDELLRRAGVTAARSPRRERGT